MFSELFASAEQREQFIWVRPRSRLVGYNGNSDIIKIWHGRKTRQRGYFRAFAFICASEKVASKRRELQKKQSVEKTSRHNNNRRNTLGIPSSKESMRKVVFSAIIEINESRPGSLLCVFGEGLVWPGQRIESSEVGTLGFRSSSFSSFFSFLDDAFDEKLRSCLHRQDKCTPLRQY